MTEEKRTFFVGVCVGVLIGSLISTAASVTTALLISTQ